MLEKKCKSGNEEIIYEWLHVEMTLIFNCQREAQATTTETTAAAITPTFGCWLLWITMKNGANLK